jgi:apolipoprotein N-acyltransferase
MDDGGYLLGKVEELQQVSADLERQGAEVIVWNESAFPYLLPRASVPGPGVLAARHLALGGDEVEAEPTFRVPLIISTTTAEVDDEDKPPWNSAFLMLDDRFAARYDKTELVWFSEHLPLADKFPSIAKIFPRGSGHFTPGGGPVLFQLPRAGGDVALAPLVCFEDTLPDYARKVGKLHPQLLVNMTNDTWFGDTAEPWQHQALATLRAVEQRVDMVRVVNTGPSGLIDAAGRQHALSEVIDPAANPQPARGYLVHAALLNGGHTVYTVIGDMVGWLAFAITLLFAFFWHRLPEEGPELPGGRD